MRHDWRQQITALAFTLIVSGVLAGGDSAQATDVHDTQEVQKFRTQKENASYAVGVEIGRTFKRQDMDVEIDLVIRGMKESLNGEKLLLNEEELLRTLNILTAELKNKQAKTRLMAAQDNKKEGEEFLASNKTKEGINTLPSGLQYKIIAAGNGKKAGDSDTVECQYLGTLINGKVVDNTYRSGQPRTVTLSDTSIIPGLREALRIMPAGSKWQLFIPHELGYGSRPSGRDIGPYSTLIYEVEVLAISSAATS